MRANLTTRDYEILSAYIDGQLAPGEQRKLEERLHARPELQVALDEMRRTRALLRQAPRRRAPRNFTLTPAMVGEQRRKPAPWAGWFPALSFTSALAALALVVTIVLQFAPPGTTSQTIAMQPPAAAMEAAPGEAEMMKKEAGSPQPQATQAADAARNAEPEAPAAESASGIQAVQTETAGPVILPAYEATAQAFGEATMEAAKPGAAGETPAPDAAMAAPAAGDAAATAPPVIQWNNNGAPPPSAEGMGGMGGGGGEGPSLGPLMGPPPAPAGEDGISGLGGGAPDGSVTLPPEAVQKSQVTPGAVEAPAAEPTPEPDVAVATATLEATAIEPTPETESAPGTPVAGLPEETNNTGPILGVPEAGEGGQITDRKAIMGEGSEERGDTAASANPEQPAADQPLVGEEPRRAPLGLNPAALTAIQVALALLAIAAGVGAYLLRLRNSRR